MKIVDVKNRYFKGSEFDYLYKNPEYLRLLTLSVEEIDEYNRKARDAIYEHRGKEESNRGKIAALKVLKDMEMDRKYNRRST